MREFLGEIGKAFPDSDIVYKEGNHEEEKYIMQNAAVLFGLDELSLPSLLNVGEHKVEYVGHKRVITGSSTLSTDMNMYSISTRSILRVAYISGQRNRHW